MLNGSSRDANDPCPMLAGSSLPLFPGQVTKFDGRNVAAVGWTGPGIAAPLPLHERIDVM
jgi:hypothetical protein